MATGAPSVDPTAPAISKTEACKTYVEQTKMLVTLASGMILGPAGSVAFLKDRIAAGLVGSPLYLFLFSEIALIFSIFFGYVVLGSIAGSQDSNEFDVYRGATRLFSILQILAYLVGLSFFVWLIVNLT